MILSLHINHLTINPIPLQNSQQLPTQKPRNHPIRRPMHNTRRREPLPDAPDGVDFPYISARITRRQHGAVRDLREREGVAGAREIRPCRCPCAAWTLALTLALGLTFK